MQFNPVLRPSEYTAALIKVLLEQGDRLKGASALEMGCGCGAVLAAMGSLGARSLVGIDVEESAVSESTELLTELGFKDIAELYRGDMWQPVEGQTFDLIAANLPHFPMPHCEMPSRLASWSTGGDNGRSLLDPFLHGLAKHLSPSGRAFITHNAFNGVDASRAIVESHGLSLHIAFTTLVYIPSDKVTQMTASVLEQEQGHTIHRYGELTFGEMHIVEIRTQKAPT